MKLIIVNRSKPDTYARLREQFAGEPGVKVVYEQRTNSRLAVATERRRLRKPLNDREFIVVHTADDDANRKRK
jgi:hypothetical protein